MLRFMERKKKPMRWIPCVLAGGILLSGCSGTNAGASSESSFAVDSAGTTEITAVSLTDSQNQTETSKASIPEKDMAAATVMVYICASDLESQTGQATWDIQQMLEARLPETVNLILETGGTEDWMLEEIDPSVNQRFQVQNGVLTPLENDLGRRNMGEAETLSDFIAYCAENYPAKRNMLILWDHGLGSLEGFGHDEYYPEDSLTLDEMQSAILDAGVTFEWIGFDACLMSTLETAWALRDCAEYLIASQDYTPGGGWDYTGWLNALAENPDIPTVELADTLMADFIKECGGYNTGITLLDLNKAEDLFEAWADYAISTGETLLEGQYGRFSPATGRGATASGEDWPRAVATFGKDVVLYDMMEMIRAVPGEKADAVLEAWENCVIGQKITSTDSYYTGLSVFLPYGDPKAFTTMRSVLVNMGMEIDSPYFEWMARMVTAIPDYSYDKSYY